MSLSTNDIVSALTSHASALGIFESVNGHEPKNPPGNGLTAALWVQRIRPTTVTTGLNRSSALLVLVLRIYSNMTQEPQDAIDPNLVAAVDKLIGAYSADFTLGGLVLAVDLLGMSGTPLEAVTGYVTVGQTMYRVADITIPVLLDSIWSQQP